MGHDARMFTRTNEVEGGYCFMHLRQYPPGIDRDREVAEELHKRTTLIPDIAQVRLYEDKEKQVEAFGEWMPETQIFRSREEVRYLEFPFVSKSRTGASSINVRMVRSRSQADREIDFVFGGGLKIHKGMQQGYLIWQRFLNGNPGDYRVIRIGRQHMILRRWNRDDKPMASGSGKFTSIVDLDEETAEVLQTSKLFFDQVQTRWCGIDLAQDPDTLEWKVLESTVGWTFKAYLDCRFIGTDFYGRDTWTVFLNELEAGVFS
jgi:glutathione synthase/RimK-type ligase-like ATP-grasp enzyme